MNIGDIIEADADKTVTIMNMYRIAPDGTLWVTVPDISKVNRVIVDEAGSKYCKVFYMEDSDDQTTTVYYPQVDGITPSVI